MAVKRSEVFEWISTLVRLAMAGILIFAAIPKLQDIQQAVRAVRAYQILPEFLASLVGKTLPFLELTLAVFLLLGLFTRISAIVWLAMMAAFMFGVAWVWYKGYPIDCGCFGGGGAVDPSEVNYPIHMLERVGFVILGAWLLIFPRTKFSLDGWMRAAD